VNAIIGQRLDMIAWRVQAIETMVSKANAEARLPVLESDNYETKILLRAIMAAFIVNIIATIYGRKKGT
jgi:hypothetical protein